MKGRQGILTGREGAEESGWRGVLIPSLRHIGNLAPWFVSVWLVVMSAWYLKTAIRSLRYPVNEGNQMQLAMGWLILVAAVVLSHLFLRRRLISVIWGLVVIGMGLTMIILSRQWIPVLIASWLLTLTWAWGDWLLRRLGAGPSDGTLEWICLACAIGLALLSMAGLTLLLQHCMSPSWVWMVLLGLTAVQWRSFVAGFDRIRRNAIGRLTLTKGETLPERGVLFVLLGVVFLFNLAWALAPEIMYDGLSYHLAVPKAYLEAGGLVKLTYGYNARLVETLFTVALALHGQIVAKLLVLATSVVAAIGVYGLGSRLFSPRVGLWAAALFYSTPTVSWLSSNTYTDLPVALFL